MKILQINTVCDKGSTGRTTRELADVIEKEGNECYVAYGHFSTDYTKSFKIGSKIENLFHNILLTRFLGLQGFGTYFGTKKLIRWIDSIKPDIIHLRNLHINYLNYPLLFQYIIKNNIPVVFTLHDCYNFTSKCSHYTVNKCFKWQHECRGCAFRNTTAPSYIFDNSRMIYNKKKKFYSQIPKMTIVAVSQWLMHEAEKSILVGNGHKVTYIYNWIDNSKFYRANNKEIAEFYKKYSLDPNYKYLISVSQGWSKNTERYRDAKRLAEYLPEGYKLILVGGTLKSTKIESPMIHIPYIAGTRELSAAYSMAEAYVHLSVEDTFGKVIAEAMSCGAVPIAFDSTACGEIAGPYGIVVKPHDVKSIVANLSNLESFKRHWQEIIQYVNSNYNYHTNAHKYLELYRELLISKK